LSDFKENFDSPYFLSLLLQLNRILLFAVHHPKMIY